MNCSTATIRIKETSNGDEIFDIPTIKLSLLFCILTCSELKDILVDDSDEIGCVGGDLRRFASGLYQVFKDNNIEKLFQGLRK